MIQAWALLGFTAYAAGLTNLWATQLIVLAWLIAATTLAQALAWGVEWIRRGPYGVLIVRTLGITLAVVAGILVATHQVTGLLDHSPTVALVTAVFAGHDGSWLVWLLGVAILVAGFAAAVCLGAWVNHAVARRQPREELKEAGQLGHAASDARAATTPPSSAPTAPASGARCRCGAASSCWRCSQVWSPQPVSSSGRCCRSCPVSSPPVERCSSASTPGASTRPAHSGGTVCRWTPRRSSTHALGSCSRS